MVKTHVKKGDEVVVIAGAQRGSRGKIIAVQPRASRVIIEGVRMVKHFQRKNAQNPQGAIIEREGPIHISNVMLAAEFDTRAAKRATPAAAGK